VKHKFTEKMCGNSWDVHKSKIIVILFCVCRFSINLQCPSISQQHKNETDIILHFNPRFPESVTVRNSMLNGEWGTEEREGEMVFKQGAEFSVDIYCEDDVFKVRNALHNNSNNYRVTSLKTPSANDMIILVSPSPISCISSSPQFNRIPSVEDVFFSFSSNDFFSIQCSESEEQ
jgi:hypothetical protein